MGKNWKFSKQLFWASIISVGVFYFISLTAINGSGFFFAEAATFNGFVVIFLYILLTIMTITY